MAKRGLRGRAQTGGKNTEENQESSSGVLYAGYVTHGKVKRNKKRRGLVACAN